MSHRAIYGLGALLALAALGWALLDATHRPSPVPGEPPRAEPPGVRKGGPSMGVARPVPEVASPGPGLAPPGSQLGHGPAGGRPKADSEAVPGPVGGALVIGGEVVELRHWAIPQVQRPAGRREEVRALDSAQLQHGLWRAELAETVLAFESLGGWLDEDGRPFFESVPGMTEHQGEELARLELRILELDAWVRMKADQVEGYRSPPGPFD